jgi:hypothetical protein
MTPTFTKFHIQIRGIFPFLTDFLWYRYRVCRMSLAEIGVTVRWHETGQVTGSHLAVDLGRSKGGGSSVAGLLYREEVDCGSSVDG